MRLNRIGRRTAICMLVLIAIALLWRLTGYG